MDERNDYNSIPMQRKTTALQNLINKFEEIKDLDYMVQVMILRGEAEKLLQQEREQMLLSHMNGQAEFDELGYRDTTKDIAEEYYNQTYQPKSEVK